MRCLQNTLKLLIFLSVSLLSPLKNAVLSYESDVSALLELKESLSDPFGVLSSWNLNSSHHCLWFGVSCDLNSRVVALNLSGAGDSFPCARIAQFPLYGFGLRRPCANPATERKVKVMGKLSPSIANLTELRFLSMPFNEITGQIPEQIFAMEHLEVLDFEGNLLSGSLPLLFNGLQKLKVINLGFNELSGVIPSSLSSCLALQVVNFAGNQLSETIHSFIGSFRYLRGLYLSFNLFTGSIPVEIGHSCSNLEHLEVSGNYLSGGIPKSLGNCNRLKTIQMFSNMLVDVIPSELGKLNQLQLLDVSRNSFSGVIPSELGNCSKLSILVLSNSWDPLPNDSRSGISQLAHTSDEFNFFKGAIPAEITSLPSLRVLWAPRGTLQGQLPVDWGSCESLEMLNLAMNFYSGKITEGLKTCRNLRFLDLNSNRLTGEISDALHVPCMTFFDVSNNDLTGKVPEFSYKACSPTQPVETMDPYDPSSAYVSYLSYRNLKETSLPFSEDSSTFSVFHSFSSNSFNGSLPSMPIASERLGKQTIYAFLAGRNKLTGTFPGSFCAKSGEIGGLMVNLSSNELSGDIWTQIGTMCKSLILLDVSSNRFSGTLPSGIGDSDSLVVLDLSRNDFQGTVPSSFGQLKALEYFSVAGNKMNGSVPVSFGQLNSLEVLDMSWNNLSGEIPSDLKNCRNLSVFLLNNNRLNGRIPLEVMNIASLTSFNLSFNNFSGPLPPNSQKCSSFIGNPLLQPCTASSSSPSSVNPQRNSNIDSSSSSSSSNRKEDGNGGFNSIEIAFITCGSAIVSVVIALIALFFYTRKCKKRSRVSGTSRKEVIVFRDIGFPLTYQNVVEATGSFNLSNCIGSGGFGATYKAEISPGFLIAVKRLSVGRFQGFQQFDTEIKTLGRLRHPNLVTLIGYHTGESEMFLIYNYLSGGNLENFIQTRSPLAVDWRILHKIALDVARALAYLHDQCVPRVLHRDVKPSNILLDEEHNAYLSDFGLARLIGASETHATTGVHGTFGYVAPEYAMTSRVSDKADVYSYGVVLLELMSDKKALDPSFSPYGNGFNIVTWACMLLREGRGKDFFADGLWDSSPHDDLIEVLHLAVRCTYDSLSTRPTMKQVAKRLKQIQPPSC